MQATVYYGGKKIGVAEKIGVVEEANVETHVMSGVERPASAETLAFAFTADIKIRSPSMWKRRHMKDEVGK